MARWCIRLAPLSLRFWILLLLSAACASSSLGRSDDFKVCDNAGRVSYGCQAMAMTANSIAIVESVRGDTAA